MSFEGKKRLKGRQINSDTWLLILEELEPIEIDSWQEGNFSYSFLRLGNRINVCSPRLLRAKNLQTREERVIEVPRTIQSGRSALSWATSVDSKP